MKKIIASNIFFLIVILSVFGQNINDFSYTKKNGNLFDIVNEHIPIMRKFIDGKWIDVKPLTLNNSHFLGLKPEEIITKREYIEIKEYNGSMKYIQIPKEIDGLPVMEIYYTAFFDRQLTSVNIPNSVAIINFSAFAFNNLTSVVIPNSVRVIGSGGAGPGAFGGNRLTSINIPNSVIILGGFESNQLTNVNIPNSVKIIGNLAFSNNKLTNINIPNSVIMIDHQAFFNNELTNITIPNSVTSIGPAAFIYNNINSITIGANVETEDSFDNGFDEIYIMNNRKAGTYIFNNGIWTIQGQRIGNQNSLLSITWAHGDTIETLKSRNPNHNFKLDNDLSVKSYVVVEGREPTITETTFIFGLDSRLVTIIYRKVGATLDVYNPLFQRFKTIYGNPKENNEFGINQHHTRINGFNVFTGDSKFENSKGSVILFVVASESNNIPYVLFTETYKY